LAASRSGVVLRIAVQGECVGSQDLLAARFALEKVLALALDKIMAIG